MKVLFIFPFLNNMYHEMGFILPPLGLGYLAASLEKENHECSIIDLNVEEDKNPQNIPYHDYDIIALSTDTTKYYKALDIAKEAKKHDKTVIFGGPHASFTAFDILNTKHCDYVIRGEGEKTLSELLSCFTKNGMHPCLSELKKIPGISFINNGMLVETENREFIDDLDTIPYPARHLMKMDKYRTLELRKRKITSLITSRGCPFDCSFCSSTRFTGLRWRTRTPKSILDETEHIINKYDFNSIAFLDDNFTLKPSRTIEISDLILERKLDLYWWCFSRCDTIVKNERMVAKMAESGCKYIFLGIESPDQIALDNMNKGISSKTAENAVSMLKKHGIDAMASYIIGQPGDTKESIADTVNFAKKLKTGGVQFSVMTPFPGTRLLENMQDKITDTNWENYDCMHLVYRHDNFDAEAMQKQLKKAYFKNYFTFSRIIKGIFSTLIGKGIKLSSIKRLFKVFKK